jgi:threonine/homoserine/homoserine lactone efflux protein
MITLTFSTIAGFVFVAALLVMSPGPNGVLIAKTMPTSGARAGFANILGFMTAFYFHGLMAVFGISALVMQSANLFTALKFAGALYLIWLGLKALADALRSNGNADAIQPHRRQRSLWAAFLEGLTTNALNPKVAMFYLAALPQFVPMNEPHAVINVLTLVFIHSLINLVWFGSLILVFANIARAARSPKLVRWLKGLTGIVFLGFGARLAMLER